MAPYERDLSRFPDVARRRKPIKSLNGLLHIGWKRLCIFLKLTGRRVMES